ncbi:unnamed protein product [Chilo suppressalis]|uniref:deoxyribose-phosphate aldolase n=1 Tax=Chilo suppressalis TaxID=168631 RepID=A0ABN8AY42_CHISP|nr:hypothetical protein evm_007064 [Chilo suppressalis]CAH0401276.1 unnamed protein product [Chilo suppressalis]
MTVPQKIDFKSLSKMNINKISVDSQINIILKNNPVFKKNSVDAWLLRAVSLIDLTTLAGDDTESNVTRLCIKAANPLPTRLSDELEKLRENESLRTAAVCVYPSRVKNAYKTIKRMELTDTLQIAAVATGFPSGLYPLKTRLEEIALTVAEGATEIDVVLDRSLVLTGQWEVLFKEVEEMKKSCGPAHMKVILGVGELGTYENVYKASMVSMYAGADFIKTSTGKEAVNATLPVGLVMCRAIRYFYQETGKKVGLKPAGGIKTPQDAVNWLVLVHTELGAEWLTPKLFRIGASSLLDVIENFLTKYESSG